MRAMELKAGENRILTAPAPIGRAPLVPTPNRLLSPRQGNRSVESIEQELERKPHLASDRRLCQREHKARLVEARQARTARDALAELPDAEQSVHLVISGRFALFDFVPATLAMAGCKIESLHIATLGFSTRNISKLVEMVDAAQIDRVWLMCSHYFAGTSAKIYDPAAEEFRKRPVRMNFLSIRTHAKILLIAFEDGRRLTFESSANLRSCKNIEQASAFGSPAIYEFHRAWMDELFLAGEVKP
jgi:hypothetical protein